MIEKIDSVERLNEIFGHHMPKSSFDLMQPRELGVVRVDCEMAANPVYLEHIIARAIVRPAYRSIDDEWNW